MSLAAISNELTGKCFDCVVLMNAFYICLPAQAGTVVCSLNKKIIEWEVFNLKDKKMKEVKLIQDKNGRGQFFIEEDKKKIARLEVILKGNELWAEHTEVDPAHEGQGIAGKLFSEMIGTVRKNKWKLVAECPYVLSKLKRHPEEYADIWNTTR